MTYEEKKAWLWRYRDADKLFRQLTCRLEEFWKTQGEPEG